MSVHHFPDAFFNQSYLQYTNSKDTLAVLLSFATNYFSNHYIIRDCLCCTFYDNK